MLTLIFANGELGDIPELPELLDQADLIIAADGGANHCFRLGIIPDMLIGDFDSVDAAILEESMARGVIIQRHVPAKDATDLELVLNLALERGATAVRLLGALGGRWDMSLANILLCGHSKYKSIDITLIGSDCLMHILRPMASFVVSAISARKVSLIPLQGDVQGLTLNGFLYPLENATLTSCSTQGISNILPGPTGTIHFQKGVLLCICLRTD